MSEPGPFYFATPVCSIACLLVQAGGLPAFQADAAKLQAAVEFAAACGGYTCTNPGAIASQPTLEQAKKLMQSAKAAV